MLHTRDNSHTLLSNNRKSQKIVYICKKQSALYLNEDKALSASRAKTVTSYANRNESAEQVSSTGISIGTINYQINLDRRIIAAGISLCLEFLIYI